MQAEQRERRALLVVDMLNDFVADKGVLTAGKPAQDIIPFVAAKAREVAAEGGKVYFLTDNHSPDDPEFGVFPPHCVRGTWGADIVPELEAVRQELGPRAERVLKTRYSGFHGTDLADRLQRDGITQTEVVGVATNICVLYNVEELWNRGYRAVVYREGVATFDPPAHDFALNQMAAVLGAVVK